MLTDSGLSRAVVPVKARVRRSAGLGTFHRGDEPACLYGKADDEITKRREYAVAEMAMMALRKKRL